jgi:hypothetical protein
MVCPIIRGKSYVGETGKSIKAVELAASQKDAWRKIAITPTDDRANSQRVKLHQVSSHTWCRLDFRLLTKFRLARRLLGLADTVVSTYFIRFPAKWICGNRLDLLAL